MRKERRSLLYKALEKLKPPVKELLIGAHVTGLSYQEMAKSYRLSRNSIGPDIRRGLDMMRLELQRTPGWKDLRVLLALPAQLLPLLLSRP